MEKLQPLPQAPDRAPLTWKRFRLVENALNRLYGDRLYRKGFVAGREQASHTYQQELARGKERWVLEGVYLAGRTMAHTINNHLTPVIGWADLLLERLSIKQDPVAIARIEQIAQAGEQVASSVASLQRVKEIRTENTPAGTIINIDTGT